MLGEGSLGRSADKNKMIYAGLVQVDDMSTPIGSVKDKRPVYKKSIAWWISGENQKVLANLPQTATTNRDALSLLRQTWNTPAPDFAEVDAINNVLKSLPESGSDDYNRKIRSLITKETMFLSGGRDTSEISSLYHDVSLDASSLLTDVKFGGLKKDINILSSQETLPEQFLTSSGDIGLRPYSSEDGAATVSGRPISSWNQLFEWSNIWDTKRIGSGQDMSANLAWDGNTPMTFIACDADDVDGMMNNRYTYVRQPILLKMYSIVALGLRHDKEGEGEGKVKPHSQICVIPLFVMWNPYNVKLKMQGAGGAPWGTHFAAHRLAPLIASANVKIPGNIWPPIDLDDASLEKFYEQPMSTYSLMSKNDSSTRAIADYGASFRNKATFKDNQLVREDDESPSFLPGEIKIFALPEDPTFSLSGVVGSLNVYRGEGRDLKVDGIVLVEGWDKDEKNCRSYGVDYQRQLRFEMLEDSGFESTLYKMRVKFAENKKELKAPPAAQGVEAIGKTPTSRISQFFYTDEYPESKGDLGSFTMVSGVMNTDELGKVVETAADLRAGRPNEKDASVYKKANPAVYNMNWGTFGSLVDNASIPASAWRAPTGGQYLPWAQSQGMSEDEIRQGKGGRADALPIYIAYYGISAKWGSKPAIGVFPAEGNNDFRAKTWQHSSPLFWGSQMVTASDLGRAYSPYQFEFKSGTAGDRISIENILSNDGEKNSIFGGPDSEQISCIIASELPLHPPYSLSGFAGMRLTPGWYENGKSDKAKIAKRFAYQSGVPGVGIGNSFADPMLPADQIFSHNEITNDPDLGDFWDHGLMANDGLWDTWFASSLSSRPSDLSGGGKESLKSVVDTALKSFEKSNTSGNTKDADLPNSRLNLTLNGDSAQNVAAELLDPKGGWEKSSKYLRLQGGFNVNSTSPIAWKSILSGLKKRQILYMDEGVPTVLPSNDNETNFSRQAITTNKTSHVDDMGALGVSHGVSHGDMTAWTDLRKIDQQGMKKLAESMIKEVKKRGPFLNMAEFVNRRLQQGENGVKGALQAAIHASGLNSVFDQIGEKIISPNFNYPHKAAAEGSIYTAAPGYLIQSDILAVLGNILTTRDDTFTVRAYGEVSDKSGKSILARAWCEAVVKRSIEYVDPINSPETPAIEMNMQTGELKDSKLSKINRAFGRKFLITSFHWLSSEEV